MVEIMRLLKIRQTFNRQSAQDLETNPSINPQPPGTLLYLTLNFNKSSGPKRRTYQIFYLVQKIAVMQRKKNLSSVDVFVAAWFLALGLRLLVIRKGAHAFKT